MTQDVDVVVDNAALARAMDRFIAAAAEAGFLLDSESVRRAVADRSMFQLLTATDRAELDRLANLLDLGGRLAEILAEPDEISG